MAPLADETRHLLQDSLTNENEKAVARMAAREAELQRALARRCKRKKEELVVS